MLGCRPSQLSPMKKSHLGKDLIRDFGCYAHWKNWLKYLMRLSGMVSPLLVELHLSDGAGN
jgi:hypothetical protein